MRYRHIVDNKDAHIRSLSIVILSLLLIIASLIWGWSQAPRYLRIYYPPDLRSGAELTAGEIPPSNVYSFAYYIFQQLNRWPADGQKDFGAAIFRLSPFLTPKYQEQLQRELKMKGNRGELSYRTRYATEIPGHGYEERRVDVLDKNTWVVWFDIEIRESVRGLEVKHAWIRYGMRVVRFDADPESNPWGLALDGYAEPPRRLTDEELAKSKESTE